MRFKVLPILRSASIPRWNSMPRRAVIRTVGSVPIPGISAMLSRHSEAKFLTLFRNRKKKFIRAEVVNWKSLVDLGGYAGLREKGMLRLEGKEYIVKDGDVLVIRHG